MRTCPLCTHGELDPSELNKGCECPYCHKLIEVDVVYSWGIPILLALTATLALRYDFGGIGVGATIAIVVFTAGYRIVWARYLPLKNYAE